MVSEFDRSFASFSDYQRTPWGRLRYEQVLHNLAAHLPDRQLLVLDAGGGNGLDAVRLARAGHHVTVLDSSPTSLAQARTHAAAEAVQERVECLVGDIRDLSVVADREFDVVLCHNVIQYVSEPGGVVAALVGVVRPGGLLSLLAPNPLCDPLVSAVRLCELDEALRLLDTPTRVSATYDLEYTPRRVDEVVADLLAAGMNPPLWYGVRSVCDLISDDAAKDDPEFFGKLVRLENALAGRGPYRETARFFHLIATKPDQVGGAVAEMGRRRVRLDIDEYESRVRTGPCFICEFLSGTPGFEHEVVYQDDQHVAFLNRYPTLPGSVLVVPRRHVEDVVVELSPQQYLDLQAVVHTVARAAAEIMNPERVYLFSMGSAQGNAHLHWHIAPLPAGVPYRDQQFAAVTADNGVLAYTSAEFTELAERIRRSLTASRGRCTRSGLPSHPLPGWVGNPEPCGQLVVIRGNSGSGKTTVAKQLQLRFERAECVVIPQDVVRREFLRESDVPDGHNIDLIRDIAVLNLARGATVVVEGILTARRYGPMLKELASHAERARFYAFDLSFSQTLQRHSTRAKSVEFGREDMRAWYSGWDPLDFVEEIRLNATRTPADIVETIMADMTVDSQSSTASPEPGTKTMFVEPPRQDAAVGAPLVVRSWGTSHTEHSIVTSSCLTDRELPDAGAAFTVGGRANGGFMQRLETSLAALLPDVPVTICNHGRGGVTSRDLASAITHTDLDQDLVLVECGTNDVLRRYQPGREHDAVGIEEFTHNYRTILHALTTRSRRVVCLVAPPVDPTALEDAGQINRDLFACNLVVRDLAREAGAQVIDYWGKFITTAALLREHPTGVPALSPWVADGIHLSPIGTELIARCIENTLLDKSIITTLLPTPVRAEHTTDIVVRRAGPQDLPAVIQVHVDVAGEQRWIGAEPPIDKVATAAGLENLIAAHDSVVIVGDNRDAGITGYGTAAFTAPGVADIALMVGAGHRRRGIGTALLHQLSDWCRNNNAHKITLQVWPHNLPAIGLCLRAGFDIEGTLRAHYRRRNGELWDALIMSRLL